MRTSSPGLLFVQLPTRDEREISEGTRAHDHATRGGPRPCQESQLDIPNFSECRERVQYGKTHPYRHTHVVAGRRCTAVCTWYTVLAVAGYIPPKKLFNSQRCIHKYASVFARALERFRPEAATGHCFSVCTESMDWPTQRTQKIPHFPQGQT